MSTGTLMLRRSVLITLFALLLGTPCFAKSYGPMTFNWRYEGQHGQSYRVVFTVQAGLLGSSDWAYGPTSNGPFSTGAHPPLGSWVNLYPGSTGSLTLPLQVFNSYGTKLATIVLVGQVTAVDPAHDLFYVTATGQMDFPSPGTYTAELATSARLSNLLNNNNDLSFIARAQVVIDPSSPNNSPVATLPPIVYIPKNQLTSFSLNVTDPDGDALTYSFATAAETELNSSVPHCGTLSSQNFYRFMWLSTGWSSSPTGVVTVETRDRQPNILGYACPYPVATGLYAVQFHVSDVRNGARLNSIPLEMLIQVVPESSGSPPQIAINGSTEPPTFAVNRGSPLTFQLTGSDPDSQPTLISGPLPEGATMTPTLPITATSPATTFTWTPTTENWGGPAFGTYRIDFAVNDSTNLKKILPVTINVFRSPPPVITCTIPATLEATSSAGGTLEVSAEVGDPDSASATITWERDGTVVHTGSLALPTWPARASTSWSYALGLGSHTIRVKASDEQNTQATCQGTVLVRDTTPPVMPALVNLVIEATSASGAAVPYVVPNANDAVDGARPLACTPASGSTFPIATTVVTCSATDGAGNSATAAFTVTVRDSTPPAIGPVVPSPQVLWPANHQFVPVGVSYSVTDYTGATCTLAVTSNEPDKGLGDGDLPGDWRVVDPKKVELRAERAGTGNGRIYTLAVRCADPYGNASTAATTVMVPQSMASGGKGMLSVTKVCNAQPPVQVTLNDGRLAVAALVGTKVTVCNTSGVTITGVKVEDLPTGFTTALNLTFNSGQATSVNLNPQGQTGDCATTDLVTYLPKSCEMESTLDYDPVTNAVKLSNGVCVFSGTATAYNGTVLTTNGTVPQATNSNSCHMCPGSPNNACSKGN